MATSIEDFDYGSVVDEIRGQTRSRKPKFLKRYGGEILSTLIGVADNYQTYKLREKMDEANFENNIEMAKIRADAAKHIKRSKETSGQYDRLLTEGFQFDDESKGSQQNLNAARKVFGEQAWTTVSSQFPNLIPRHNFKNYQDYEDQRASWGMNEESHKAVENLYNSVVMDKANYVRSGQAFDFEKFNVNLKSLEEQGITIDPDNYGLLSKIGGKLARNLEYQQEQIAAFRNRYLTSELEKGVEAMEQWTGSQTPEQYYEAVKNSDLGIWASLPAEDAALLTQLSPGLKQEATDALQKVMHKNPNISSRQMIEIFDSVVFGDQGRTAATAQFTLAESQARKAINADSSLTEEQKSKARQETNNFYDNLKNQYSLYSEDKVTRLIGSHNVLRAIQKQIEPLIAAQGSGTLLPDQKERLRELKLREEYAKSSIEYIDSPTAEATYFTNKRLERVERGDANSVAEAHIQVHFTKPQNVKDKNEPSVLFTIENANQLVIDDPDMDTQTKERLAMLAVAPLEFTTKNVSGPDVNLLVENVVAEVRFFGGQALENIKTRQSIFNTSDEDELNDYINFLGVSAASDKAGARLSLNMTKLAQHRFYAQQVLSLSKQSIDRGQLGYFHGLYPAGEFTDKINMDAENVQRQLMMRSLIQDFTATDPKTDDIIVKPSSLEEVAKSLYKGIKQLEDLGNPGVINANAEDSVLQRQFQQFKAIGDEQSAETVEGILNGREEEAADKAREEATPEAIRQRNYEATYETIFGVKPGGSMLEDFLPVLKDEGTSDIPDEKKNKISDGETESLLGKPTKEVPISTDDMGELLRGERSGVEFDAPASNIVEQVASEVSELFNDGGAATALLRETAIQESNMGQAPGTYKMVDDKSFGRGSFGVGQVDERNFEDTLSRLRGDKGQPRNLVKYVQIFKDKLDIDLTDLEYEDLIDPKLGLIFTRLHYLKTADPVPPTVQGRAEYWKKFYNTSAGAGTPDEYLSNQESYAKIYGKE